MPRSLPATALVLCAALSMNASATPSASTDALRVDLVSEQAALVPGATAWLGLRLRHTPQWHTYWVNPGDSGLPTRLAWQLPAGFSAGAIGWPAPQRFDVDGLANFGFAGDVLLPVPVSVPADAAPGTRVHVAVEAKWLACHEECVPGKATLALDMPVAKDATASADAALFAAARAAQPEGGAFKAQARLVGDAVEVSVRGAGLDGALALDAFAEEQKVIANTKPAVSRRDGATVLRFARSDAFDGAPPALTLVLRDGTQRALRVRAPFTTAATPAAAPSSTPASR